jgi:hypothetical protein
MRSDSVPSPRTAREGFALLAALLALFWLGAMLLLLAFISREDHALSVAARDSQRAFGAAELAAWSTLAALDTSHLAANRGEPTVLALAAEGSDTARGAIVRLGRSVFLVLGEAGVRGSGSGLAWRRAGLFVSAWRDSTGGLVVRPLPGRSWVELP